jgi:hypothetical protein
MNRVMPKLRWPLPALLAWASAWLVFALAQVAGLPVLASMLLALAWGGVLGFAGETGLQRISIMFGFPLSLAVAGVVDVPAWAWLLPLGFFLLVYPVRAWRDAPVFPTPAGALLGLEAHAPLLEGARLLDAGCGAGDGLKALREAYATKPLHLEGIEWSWPLRVICALRCPWAKVRRGDIWRANWDGYAMVYLFQRPESMPRAVAKAMAQMSPGAWLVSLEFEAQSLMPQAKLHANDGRPVWLYRAPFLSREAEAGSANPERQIQVSKT